MRKSRFLMVVAVLAFIICGFWASNAHAAPAPYSGGASVAKVIYPADGSTVTITSTGAVIKQSPGGNPYREGWINPSDICDINVSSDLNGRLRAGSSNPYDTGTGSSSASSCTSSQSTNNSNQNTKQPAATVNNTNTANASVVLAGSGHSAKSSQSSTGQTSSASSNTSKSGQSGSNSSAQSLPNTGPGDVFAIGGVSAVLGTLGHFFTKRLRYKYSA